MESWNQASVMPLHGFRYEENEQSCFYIDEECINKKRNSISGTIRQEQKEKVVKKEIYRI